jgi:hypothetical protein
VSSIGILENYRYLAAGFWYGATVGSEPAASPVDGVLTAMGHSTPEQVYLRALAMDGYALGEVLQAAVARVDAGWGFEPIPLRRFTC